MNCANCKYNDGKVYTSLPPKYKCTITDEFHEAYGDCNVDFVPVVRCKDCKWHVLEQPGMVYCPATVCGWVEDDWFCKGGERKDDE